MVAVLAQDAYEHPASTLRSYTEHVERHLIPHLGGIRLGELTGRDVASMFAALTTTDTRYGRPLAPSTLHRPRHPALRAQRPDP